MLDAIASNGVLSPFLELQFVLHPSQWTMHTRVKINQINMDDKFIRALASACDHNIDTTVPRYPQVMN
ncbi:hypothetical protein RZS08_57590, partial [Arthrospira platensis SPKY1]|nr:hypothetical protein [Arthrospira platensis SPKY1]